MTRVKTGGRQVGTPNAVTERVKGDLLAVYKALGGRRWLLAYARAHEDEFCKHLMRLVPPPRSETEEAESTPFEPHDLRAVAMRISYVLAIARQQAGSAAPVDIIEAAPAQAPEPEPASELPPLDEFPTYSIPDLRGQEVVEETRTETLQIYRGGSAEQGRSQARPEVIDARRKAHDGYLARLAAHHRRNLL
ncbi:hypothetical protein [Polaromonas sp. JS666]|uniref:hypothetical protein n=1 Tax=Polaromonas sp. (strain JS666 / ATCC BAA-500) TaxID=296591 RepID=UPI0000464970|nr:hypothetical protein [Polaromonas sp. JS666]ABE43257.1 hypothetical protein Bpro_1307 [Polaromonas sp. JS666]